MAVTLIGQQAMQTLLDGRGRTLVVNRTEPDDEVTIVAAALVRHFSGGTTQNDATFALDIGADESVALDPLPPAAETPEAVEVLLRLTMREGQLVDAYVVAHRSAEEPDAAFEVGIKKHDGVLGDGEELVPDFPQFAVYGLPVE